jgi:hypothetical protein
MGLRLAGGQLKSLHRVKGSPLEMGTLVMTDVARGLTNPSVIASLNFSATVLLTIMLLFTAQYSTTFTGRIKEVANGYTHTQTHTNTLISTRRIL